MINTIFKDKKNQKVKYTAETFNLGDIVKVENTGGVYSTYEEAFKLLNVHSYDLTNWEKDDFYTQIFHVPIHGLKIKRTKEDLLYRKWIVLGKCKAKAERRVMLFIFDPKSKNGLLIGDDCVKLIASNPYGINETNLNFYEVPK